MILPIISFGNSVLRAKCKNISKDYKDLDDLLSNMWETMYASRGVGLAAPQINNPIRVFIIDTQPFYDDEEEKIEGNPLKKVKPNFPPAFTALNKVENILLNTLPLGVFVLFPISFKMDAML